MNLKHMTGYTTNYNTRTKGDPNMKEAIDDAIGKNVPHALVGLMPH